MRELLAELTSILDRRGECVYCAVIDTRGSTPQKPGAAMLVFPNGSQFGTLGGGCVEAEVRLRALQSMRTGQPQVHTFNLDDNYGWDDGLICGGRMTVLTDPIPAADSPVPARRAETQTYYRKYRELVELGLGCTEAVVAREQISGAAVGTRYLFDADGWLAGTVGGREPPPELVNCLVHPRQRARPSVRHGIAFIPILPRITLLVVGGGHVGQAVARLASEVDFELWVVDDRERYASKERFPTASRLLVGDIGPTLKGLIPEITASVYCLIITRGHAHDEEALYHLAPTAAGYVGMIGSTRKIKLIYEDLIGKGVGAESLAKVRAPLGLPIGSQTVPEIAVSIVAELIACRNLGHTILEARAAVFVGDGSSCSSH